MRAFVLTDASLERRAGQFVWLAIDTEKPENAAFKRKFPWKRPDVSRSRPGETAALDGSVARPFPNAQAARRRAARVRGTGVAIDARPGRPVLRQASTRKRPRIPGALAAAPKGWPVRAHRRVAAYATGRTSRRRAPSSPSRPIRSLPGRPPARASPRAASPAPSREGGGAGRADSWPRCAHTPWPSSRTPPRGRRTTLLPSTKRRRRAGTRATTRAASDSEERSVPGPQAAKATTPEQRAVRLASAGRRPAGPARKGDSDAEQSSATSQTTTASAARIRVQGHEAVGRGARGVGPRAVEGGGPAQALILQNRRDPRREREHGGSRATLQRAISLAESLPEGQLGRTINSKNWNRLRLLEAGKSREKDRPRPDDRRGENGKRPRLPRRKSGD